MKNVLCSLFALLFVVPLLAQEHPNVAHGFSPDKIYNSLGPDTISTFNGNLTITIQIGPRYQVSSNLSYGFNLIYNARPWETVQVSSNGNNLTRVIPNRSSNAGMGWILSPGSLILWNDPRNTSNQAVYESPDGGQHAFYQTLHDNDPSFFAVQYTRDGTYLRLKGVYAPGGGDPIAYEVEFPNGNIDRFDPNTGDLTQMRDRFNNSVNFTWNYTEIVNGDNTRPLRLHICKDRSGHVAGLWKYRLHALSQRIRGDAEHHDFS